MAITIPEHLKPCRTERICDDNDATIFPMMKYLVVEQGLSERKASEIVSQRYPDGMVTATRARKVYDDRKSGTLVPQKSKTPENTPKIVKGRKSQGGAKREGAGQSKSISREIPTDNKFYLPQK